MEEDGFFARVKDFFEGKDGNPSDTSKAPEMAFLVRAQVSPGSWQTVGAAWPMQNGSQGYSVKLNTIPAGQWDGLLLLLPPAGKKER